MPGIAAHDRELAEPVVDEQGADDADDHENEDDGPLVEYVFEAASVHLVHAQKEPAVRCKTCQRSRVGETAARFTLIGVT